jgi:hypothetical protein
MEGKMKYFKHFFYIALCASALAVPARAEDEGEAKKVDFNLTGYFRVRPKYFSTLSLNKNDTNRAVSFIEQRLRLEPDVKVGEKIDILAQVDMLDNMVWGDNRAFVDANGDGIADSNGASVFSNNPGYPPQTISVKRAWAEVMTAIGMLKFGRMGSNWGTGFYYNDGNGLDAEWGDKYTGTTVDRFQFILKAGSLYIVPMYDKVVEGPVENDGVSRPMLSQSGTVELNALDGDTDQYILALLYKLETAKLGLYLVQRVQPVPTRADITTYDAYFTKTFQLGKEESETSLTLDLEAMVNQGQFYAPSVISPDAHKIKVNSYGGVGRSTLKIGMGTLGLESGIASGPHGDEFDPVTNPGGKRRESFSFNSDYNVALLMFEEKQYSRQALPNPDTFNNPIGASDGTGNPAVADAFYVKFVPKYNIADLLEAKAGVIWGMTAPYVHKWKLKANNTYGNNEINYGTEIDVGLEAPPKGDMRMGVQAGYLIPGSFFKTSSEKADNAYSIQGRFSIAF